MVKFTANKSLVVGNIKDLSSPTILVKDIIVSASHSYKSFLIMVKVYLGDAMFTLVKYAFNFGDFLRWIKDVTFG